MKDQQRTVAPSERYHKTKRRVSFVEETAVVDQRGCVQGRITVLASHTVNQLTDGSGWNAVVTSTTGRGTFWVRHRPNHKPAQCPLLDYEVRRIDTGIPQES